MERLSQRLIRTAQPISGVELPNYDRSALKAGIVHIGPGNFPLAHMAYKTHQLMQSGDTDALNYGIVTVNTQSAERRDNLRAQDGLYTIAEQDREGVNNMIVVGSVIEALYAPTESLSTFMQLASPDTRIVSMTVTPDVHQSYVTANRRLNSKHPDIQNDLDPKNVPRTYLGLIVRAIQKREATGLPGFTVMNLDNMVHNGDYVYSLIQQFAATYDDKLGAAIDAKYTFPNSMVDRIVPKTSPELLDQVSAKTGFADMIAIPAEPMPLIGSWVIEDKFANGCPNWASAGLAQIVPDVLPYEQAKLRLLNVTHSMIACLGDLEGKELIDQDMNDPLFVEAVATLMKNETGPTLAEVPGIDMEAYKQEIIARFANEKVRDTNQRVATDAPLAVVLDTARDQIHAGGSYELLALNTAAWIRRFAVDKNQAGGDIITRHAVKDQLVAAARAEKNEPAPVFALTGVFGDLGQDKQFAAAVRAYMHMLDKEGIRATLAQAIYNSNDITQRNMAPNRVRTVTAPSTDLG